MPGPILIPPGFFGKLPAHGDFVTRRLPMGFVAVWDPWVALHLARRADFPPLRFAHPGTAGGAMSGGAMTGVVLPSRDRAGRAFPLTLAAAGASAPEPWYEALTEAGVAAARGECDADALAARLETLDPAEAGAPPRPLLWLAGGVPAAIGPEALLAEAEAR